MRSFLLLASLTLSILSYSQNAPKQKQNSTSTVKTEKEISLTEKITQLEKRIAVNITDPTYPKAELQKEKEQLKQLKQMQAKSTQVKTN
jgi:hypothetical protein